MPWGPTVGRNNKGREIRGNIKTEGAKPNEVEATFLDKIWGLAIIKLLDRSTQNAVMLRVTFTRNITMLDITNRSSEILIICPKVSNRVLDLWSLGYYKIWQGENECNQFNNLINTLNKE